MLHGPAPRASSSPSPTSASLPTPSTPACTITPRTPCIKQTVFVCLRMSERPPADDTVGAAVAELERALRALAQRLDGAAGPRDLSSSNNEEEAEGEGPSPLVLLGRLEKLQHDTLPRLRARCERVVQLKRELVAATRAALLPARAQLIDLQLAAGVALLPTRGPFEALTAVLAAWDRACDPQPGSSLPPLAPPPHQHQQQAQSLHAHQPGRKRPRLSDGSDRHGERQLEMIAAAGRAGGVDDSNNEDGNSSGATPSGMRSSERFVPVSEAEFAAVSTVVRGRCRREDVNALYEQLFLLRQQPPPHGVRRWPATVAELSARGVRVAGLSGEQKLATLRALGIVAPSKTGVALVEGLQQPPPPS